MRRNNAHLVLCLLLALAAATAPARGAAWVCEGAVCSTDAQGCCCTLPNRPADTHCDAAASGLSGPCAGECGCSRVTSGTGRLADLVRAASADASQCSIAPSSPAVAAVPPASPRPVQTNAAAARPPRLVPLGLRAPPA